MKKNIEEQDNLNNGVEKLIGSIFATIVAGLFMNDYISYKSSETILEDENKKTFSLEEDKNNFRNYVNSLKNNKKELKHICTYLEENKENIHSYVDNLRLMNEEKIKSYISKIDEVKSHYNYEDLYITKEDVDKIIEKSKTTVMCEHEFIDCDEYLEMVVSNSNNYAKENSKYLSIFSYEDDNVKIDEYGVKIDLLLSLMGDFDIDCQIYKENICKIKNLKIMVDNNLDAQGQYLPDENLIVLNMKEIENSYLNMVNEDYSSFKEYRDIYAYIAKILKHELNYVQSFICDHRKENGQNYDTISMNLDDGDHIGYILNEASSESDLYKKNLKQMKEYPYTYNNYRKIESLLWLLSIFNNSSVEEYYNSIQNTDLNTYFKFFNLTTDEDIYSFYKILYGLEAREAGNNFLSKIYPDKKSISMKEAYETVGNGCFVDLYKMFLKRLIKYTIDNDLSLEENIILNRFALSLILDQSNHDLNEAKTAYTYDDNFKNDMSKLNELYRNFIKDFYGVNLSEIDENLILSRLNEMSSYKKNSFSSKIFDKFDILKNIIYSFGNIDINLKFDYLDEDFSKTLKLD